MKTTTTEVWVLVDTDGQTAIGYDADAAKQQYAENVGELAECDGYRLYRLELTVPVAPPVVELTGTVPDGADGGEVLLKVAAG